MTSFSREIGNMAVVPSKENEIELGKNMLLLKKFIFNWR
jgi:hypothetical protein